MNYNLELEKILDQFKYRRKRPKLLLHSCCAPCSSVVIERLGVDFEIAVYYYNPNIAPQEEFEKRLLVQKKFLSTAHPKLQLLVGKYEDLKFKEAALGFETEPEGAKRCRICFELRLKAAAAKAEELSFEFFATTLTTSPRKDAKVINELGAGVAKSSKAKFLCADFKKKDGYKRSIELSKEFGLYRQSYCGCVFSQRK